MIRWRDRTIASFTTSKTSFSLMLGLQTFLRRSRSGHARIPEALRTLCRHRAYAKPGWKCRPSWQFESLNPVLVLHVCLRGTNRTDASGRIRKTRGRCLSRAVSDTSLLVHHETRPDADDLFLIAETLPLQILPAAAGKAVALRCLRLFQAVPGICHAYQRAFAPSLRSATTPLWLAKFLDVAPKHVLMEFPPPGVIQQL